jgi:hypothetical protein
MAIVKYTEELALMNLKEYYNILKRIPMRIDFKNNNWKPEFGWYAEKFGSFRVACIKAEILYEIIDKEERLKYTINYLKELADKLNKCPNVKEYDQYRDKAYTRDRLCEITTLTYGEICIKYLSDKYECNKKYLPNKETIIKHLNEVYNKLGRTPLSTETNYAMDVYIRVFNKTYNQILLDLGFTPSCVTPIIKTDKQLLDEFLIFFNKHKRIPLALEMNIKNNNLSSYGIYNARFGNIQKICELLNIDYTKYSTISNSIGKVCFDKLGNTCKSYEEKIISDFFIENDLYILKAPKYNELIEKDRRVFDWKIKFNGKIFYVEYFGMYYNKTSKMVVEYREKADKKIKDLTITNNLVKCIFIYPEDLYKGIDNFFKKIFGVEFKLSNNIADFRPYSERTDKELLSIIMNFSNNENFLPYWYVLVNNGNKQIYDEIIYRYKSYINFAKLFNKNVPQRKANTWNNDVELYKMFEYMINTYGKILNPKEFKKFDDYNLKGYNSAFSKVNGSYLNRKLNFLKEYSKIHMLSETEIKWLRMIANNQGTGIKDKVSKDQRELARYIINNNIKIA